MIVNLASAKGPSGPVLNMLERLARWRAVFAAPADQQEACVAARALATLDDMEECLCEEGTRAAHLDRSWQVLEGLQARLTQLRATAPDAAADPLPPATTASTHRPRAAIEARPTAGRRRRFHSPGAPNAPMPMEIPTC